MALGFGFNKTKVMQAAERNVLQGKLPSAIAEYEKVINHEPDDLTVLNTLGDLYICTGRTEDALQCFRKVADTYAAEGFAMKAIAMYKKITKQNPQALDCLLKLGELYSLQSLFSEARAQYIAAAEHQLSKGDSEGAAAVYRKALELDPDNPHLQQRLAELYSSSGRQEHAAETYLKAAESLHGRGRHAAALDMIEKLLRFAPKHLQAALQYGRIATDFGDPARAIPRLEAVIDGGRNAEPLRQLIHARTAAGQLDSAADDARTLLNKHSDASGIIRVSEALLHRSSPEAALRLLEHVPENALKEHSAAISRILQAAVGQHRGNIPVLEAALHMNRRAGERGCMVENIELLAQACVQAGQNERAQKLYEELAQLEPENEMHLRNLEQLGSKKAAPESEDASLAAVDALTPAPAPAGGEQYPEETQRLIEAALTDAELFQSYNSAARAISALEAALAVAPRDVTVNQRLAAAYVRGERYGEAAERFAILREAYEASGQGDEARQCAAMEAKYRERAALARPASTAPKAAAEPEPGAAEPTFPLQPGLAADPGADEWEALASEVNENLAALADDAPEAGACDASPEDEAFAGAVEEGRFYLLHGLSSEAESALERALELRPQAPEAAELRAEIEAARQPAAADAAGPAQEPAEEEPPVTPLSRMYPRDEPIFGVRNCSTEPATRNITEEESQHGYAENEPRVALAAAGVRLKAAPAPREQASRPLNRSHMVSSAPAGNAPQPSKKTNGAVRTEVESSFLENPLDDILAEFRSSLAPPAGDLDQHYNMGVALKDMGLLDEAIGELQQVCNALERGAEFGDALQAYTWLAHCLVERGVPQAALRWYKRALALPHLDPDARVAIHYELGLAYEQSGSRDTALEHFMEAYGSNIDYRDVADRIEALRA
ncbi:MAG: tetratricopeptide repeat protein [Acidobacteria bacterium]|nr:tetratricopeptide repeat protein [Acidobacteriota bacterium]